MSLRITSGKALWKALALAGLACLQSGCDGCRRVPVVELAIRQRWGGAGSTITEVLGYPGDFIVTNQGELVVTDVRGNRLLFFSREGELLRRVGGPGAKPLQFAIPDDIAICGDRFAIWDYQNNRVQYLSLDGQFLGMSVPEPRIDFNAKTFDRDGNLYYATAGFRADSLVYVYSPEGELIKTFGGLEGEKFDSYDIDALRQALQRRQLPDVLKNNVLLAATVDQGLFVAHTALPLLKKFSRGGELLFRIELDDPVFSRMHDAFFASNDALPGFAFKPLRYWNDIAGDGRGGAYLLLADPRRMIVHHYDATGRLVERLLGPADNILKIAVDGDQLWAFGRQTMIFYCLERGKA